MRQQQQKTREAPPAWQRTLERVLALVDLIFAVPLAYMLLLTLRYPTIWLDPLGWPRFVPLLLIAVGLLAAGVQFLRHKRAAALKFQGLASVGGVLLALFFIVTMLWPRTGPDALLLLRTFWPQVLGTLLLILLPVWLRDLEQNQTESTPP